MTAVVFLGSLLGSMAIGVPIAFALVVCGVALMLYLGTFDAQIVSQNLVSGADSFQLLAVPFFLLAGESMTAGGLSRRIVDLASALVGHLRGAPAMSRYSRRLSWPACRDRPSPTRQPSAPC